MPEVSRAIRLCGIEEADASRRLLRAGPLSAELEAGNLRYIRFAGIEVLRGIAFLVRDANWGTLSGEVCDLSIEESADAFSVAYRGRCDDGSIRLVYDAKIRGAAKGSLSFEASVLCESEVRTNRTGFVVLHPLAGVAGRPARVLHTDGRETMETFPGLISPGQPMFDIRSLSHEIAPGVWATCTMEGDAFEMEDHRNWSDASYKTYIRPLGKPWPYTLAAGSRHEQSVVLTVSGRVPAAAASDAAPIAISVNGETGGKIPAIGVGVSAQEASHALKNTPLLRRLGPRLLVCQIDARQPPDAGILGAYRELAAMTGAPVTLEIIIPGTVAPVHELAPVAAAVRRARLTPDAVSVFPASDLMSHQPGHEDKTVPPAADICAAARAAFPGVRLGGGMASYFTELNRKRPPTEFLDFIIHTTCPIVHAADDRSVMETLEALPAIIASTVAFSGGHLRRVGPSAIGCRQNPYGAAPFETDGASRVCLARIDPRQRGLFGAAWALGYIAAFARGGLEAIAIGAPTGPFGAIYRRTEYAQPYFDALDCPAVYPVFHILAGLARASGRPMLQAVSARPRAVEAIAFRSGDGIEMWLCNLTAEPVTAKLEGLPSAISASVIDAASFTHAAVDPDWLDALRTPLTNNSIALDAYAVARVIAH
jgi:hypothetical protein